MTVKQAIRELINELFKGQLEQLIVDTCGKPDKENIKMKVKNSPF